MSEARFTDKQSVIYPRVWSKRPVALLNIPSRVRPDIDRDVKYFVAELNLFGYDRSFNTSIQRIQGDIEICEWRNLTIVKTFVLAAHMTARESPN